ncbi:four helix bundle protein [Candidatus Falkowbacteria bacterium]|nr:four helix bundle protein [Candidatus Falkowbacteria bacterium]
MQQLNTLLQKAKDLYLLWYGYYKTIPKEHRHTLGQKIDFLFIEILEAISVASFSAREQKLPYVQLAIRKTDVLKLFLLMLWETRSIDNKKYATLSEKLDEIGKMLGGWQGQLKK